MSSKKKSALLKFILLLGVFLGYFLLMSMKYGVQEGFHVSILTWSFFVLCTPVADAGFLLDFPIRLITNIRMVSMEIGVWAIAIIFNIYTYFKHPITYSKTPLLTIFNHILSTPNPYWIIIFLSMIGTFVSIIFGDEVMDSVIDKNTTQKSTSKYKWIIMSLLFIGTFYIYDRLLKNLGVHIDF